MVTGTNGYAVLVEVATDFLGSETVEHKRQHAGLFLRCSDDVQSRDASEFVCGMHEQFMLVARDVVHANPIQIVDSSAKANGVSDVSSARLEALRRLLVDGLLEGYVLNHVSTTLPRWHVFENFRLAVDNTDACRREDLVAGEDKKIAVQRLHIHAHVGDRLRAIKELAP